MIDLHIHSNLSPDGQGPMQNFIQVASSRGLKIIGFTEHWDFDRWDENKEFNIHKQSELLCRSYKGTIEVLFGAELAYHQKYKNHVEHYLDQVCPDFILGSVHEVEGYMITELEETGHYFEKFGKKGFGMYFDAVGMFAQEGIFDILGHLDVIKRFSMLYRQNFILEQYKNTIMDILKVLAKRDKAIEVNTSGLRQAPGSTYPSLNVVEWFVDLGGKYITIGSDSHTPETVGYSCDSIISNLHKKNIIDITIYRKREPICLNIIQ